MGSHRSFPGETHFLAEVFPSRSDLVRFCWYALPRSCCRVVKGPTPMPHPLIVQLRFTRSEFKRGLEGLTEAEAVRRFLPMNCISWNIGHLAWQEQRYWLTRLQGQTPLPELHELVGNGRPASTPSLVEMWERAG